MYTWIASWVSGTSTENKDDIYVQSDNQETNTEDWTWVEVIEDNKERETFVFIQTDKDLNRKDGTEKTSKTKKRKRFSKEQRQFLKLLRVDHSITKTVKSGKHIRRFLPTITLKSLCKKHQTISEILSQNSMQKHAVVPLGNQRATFNMHSSMSQIEVDLMSIYEKANIIKIIMETLLKFVFTKSVKSKFWLAVVF